MENMKRKFVGNIPVWEWKGIPLIRIGKDEFFTVKPVEEGVRTLKRAKDVASEFAKKHKCHATVAYEIEWLKMIEFLKINYACKAFLEENDLKVKEALLLDSDTDGDTHLLAGGRLHLLNEIFQGFISGDDADGEPQPEKLVFLTIKIL
jgi:hypothetical protein